MRRALPEKDRTATRASFVERLRDLGDDATWAKFVERYGGLIHRVAQRAGLRPDEADDVVQETALSVARTMAEFVYEPAQCSFEGWVRRMARIRIADQLRRRSREERVGGGGDGALERASEDGGGGLGAEWLATPEGDEAWAAEWKQMILERALDQLRKTVNPESYQIFFMTAMEERSGADVARILDVSQAKVYVVRHRLLGRLQKEVEKIRADVESGAELEWARSAWAGAGSHERSSG